LRHDFIHVLSQMIMENFFIPLREWCEQNSLISRVQSHGSIGELLQSYASNSVAKGAGDAARAANIHSSQERHQLRPHLW